MGPMMEVGLKGDQSWGSHMLRVVEPRALTRVRSMPGVQLPRVCSLFGEDVFCSMQSMWLDEMMQDQP